MGLMQLSKLPELWDAAKFNINFTFKVVLVGNATHSCTTR